MFEQLGLLLRPINDLIFDEANPKAKIAYVRSKFMDEKEIFLQQVREFCKSGKHYFHIEYLSVKEAVDWFRKLFDTLQYQDVKHARQAFPDYNQRVKTRIFAIPCEDPDTILPEGTPYDTYLRLRAMFQKATNRIQVFDSWLGAAVFHRYLSDVPDDIEITIVTEKSVMEPPKTEKRNIQLRDEIVAISELLATQRGDSYRFLVAAGFHDRHVRVDQDIFHMGGSAKDASKKDMYTISKLDPTSSNHTTLDELISNADEWFGPTNQKHRRE